MFVALAVWFCINSICINSICNNGRSKFKKQMNFERESALLSLVYACCTFRCFLEFLCILCAVLKLIADQNDDLFYGTPNGSTI